MNLFKNKSGIITAGITAIIGGFVILIIASLLLFISFNKFAIIGGGLVALTLIFGLKGDFSKQKAVFMTLIIGLGLFFVLGGDMLQEQFGPEPSHLFISKDLGTIVTNYPNNWLSEQAYFKNAAGSGIDSANFGEPVRLCDSQSIAPGYKYTSFHRIFKLDGVLMYDLDLTSHVTVGGGRYCTTFFPPEVGTYEVVTQYTLCPDIYGPVRPSDCYTRLVPPRRYFLEVRPVEEVCHLVPYTGGRYILSTIPNGKIYREDIYRVTSDCSHEINYYNEYTICSSGFVISGSSLTQTEGVRSCVTPPVPEVDDPVEDTPIEDDPSEIDPICDVDLEVNCGDGTKIIEKLCIDGAWIETGAECEIIGSPSGSGGSSDDLLPPIQATKNFMQENGTVIIGIFLFMVIVIGGIIIYKRRK